MSYQNTGPATAARIAAAAAARAPLVEAIRVRLEAGMPVVAVAAALGKSRRQIQDVMDREGLQSAFKRGQNANPSRPQVRKPKSPKAPKLPALSQKQAIMLAGRMFRGGPPKPKPAIVEDCVDTRVVRAMEMLRKGADPVEVRGAVGLPLAHVFRLRMEVREARRA